MRDGAKDMLMGRLIEGVFVEDVEDLRLGLALNQHRAQDRHLRLIGLRRGFVDQINHSRRRSRF